jgi:YVTN family beta-propeller protein
MIGTNTGGIAVSPDGNKIYVTNGIDSVSVINSTGNTVSSAIAVGNGPLGIAVSPDGSKVYVANEYDNTVNVINTATDTISATIKVGSNPVGVCINPNGRNVYVANADANTISVINSVADTVSATIKVGNDPEGISVSPNGNRVFVANWRDNTVDAISASENIITATIPVGSGPLAFGNFISTYTIPVGIAAHNIASESINIYPNPAKVNLTIEDSYIATNEFVSVYDTKGQLLLWRPLLKNITNFDVSAFDKGLYFLKVENESGYTLKKFVKE